MSKFVPQEVIVVEGRDDAQRLFETFGPQMKVIETGGSAVSRKVLERITRASHQYGIIVFTDPDYQGDRIRRIVTQHVPQAKQAYLSQDKAQSPKAGTSLGVEHASKEAIRQALENVMTPISQADIQVIPIGKLMDLKLVGHPQSNLLRQKVAEHFNLGHVNGKQLQKRLALYDVGYQELKDFMKGVTDE